MKTDNNIALKWKGPFTLENLDMLQPEEFHRGGIYIWGFLNDGMFLPRYIGKANSITKISSRIYQHISSIKSGFCIIWNKNKNFNLPSYEDKESRIKQILFCPPVNIRKNHPNYEEYQKKIDYLEVLKNWDKYKLHIDFMVKHFAFAFANCSDDKINDAEKKIINDNKDILTNIRGGETTIKITHKGEKSIMQFLKTNGSILNFGC